MRLVVVLKDHLLGRHELVAGGKERRAELPLGTLLLRLARWPQPVGEARPGRPEQPRYLVDAARDQRLAELQLDVPLVAEVVALVLLLRSSSLVMPCTRCACGVIG